MTTPSFHEVQRVVLRRPDDERPGIDGGHTLMPDDSLIQRGSRRLLRRAERGEMLTAELLCPLTSGVEMNTRRDSACSCIQ